MTLALHPHGDLVRSTADQFVSDVCASIDRALAVGVEIDFGDVSFMDSELADDERCLTEPSRE